MQRKFIWRKIQQRGSLHVPSYSYNPTSTSTQVPAKKAPTKKIPVKKAPAKKVPSPSTSLHVPSYSFNPTSTSTQVPHTSTASPIPPRPRYVPTTTTQFEIIKIWGNVRVCAGCPSPLIEGPEDALKLEGDEEYCVRHWERNHILRCRLLSPYWTKTFDNKHLSRVIYLHPESKSHLFDGHLIGSVRWQTSRRINRPRPKCPIHHLLT